MQTIHQDVTGKLCDVYANLYDVEDKLCDVEDKLCDVDDFLCNADGIICGADGKPGNLGGNLRECKRYSERKVVKSRMARASRSTSNPSVIQCLHFFILLTCFIFCLLHANVADFEGSIKHKGLSGGFCEQVGAVKSSWRSWWCCLSLYNVTFHIEIQNTMRWVSGIFSLGLL